MDIHEISLEKQTTSKPTKVKASRSVRCNICMETFSQGFALKEHMRVHTGDKPHSCKICQKTFRHATNLQRHTEIHTVNKPYGCSLCEKFFRRKAHLVKHQKTIHKVTQIKSESKINAIPQSVSCKKCGKKCKSMKDMRKHWAWHCYAQSSLYTNPMHGDNSRSNYDCESCGKKFTNQLEYNSHAKTYHSKENSDIWCIDCKQCFETLRDLNGHLKLNHVFRENVLGTNKNVKDKLDFLSRLSPVIYQERDPSFIEGCECAHPFYEVDSLDDLFHLSIKQLEEECHLHGIQKGDNKQTLVESVWNHYTQLHPKNHGYLDLLEKTF